LDDIFFQIRSPEPTIKHRNKWQNTKNHNCGVSHDYGGWRRACRPGSGDGDRAATTAAGQQRRRCGLYI